MLFATTLHSLRTSMCRDIPCHRCTLRDSGHSKLWWTTMATLGVSAYLVWDWLRRRPRVDDVTKKCVFITGCDSGFGRALAVRLDLMGVTVFAGCFTEDGAEELKAATSRRLKTIIVDVRDSESIHKAYDFVKDNLQDDTRLWGIVNNAGIAGVFLPTECVNRKVFSDVMAVNFFGVTEVTSTFMPLLKKSKGRIVNTSSMSGFAAFPFTAPYGASKSALLGYTDALRMEKKEWGINVSCIEPGTFRTPLFNQQGEKKREEWESLPEEIRDEYGEEYLDKLIAMFDEGAHVYGDPNIARVVDAYEHALFSRKPRAHYVVGWDARIGALMPRFVLEKLVDLTNKAKIPKPKVLQIPR